MHTLRSLCAPVANGLELPTVLQHFFNDLSLVAAKLWSRHCGTHLELVERVEIDIALTETPLLK